MFFLSDVNMEKDTEIKIQRNSTQAHAKDQSVEEIYPSLDQWIVHQPIKYTQGLLVHQGYTYFCSSKGNFILIKKEA